MWQNYNRYILLFLLLSIGQVILGQTVKQTLIQANEAYLNNKFKEAITLYESILEKNYESAALYYNLGNAYYQEKEIAPAILNYERAKKLNPYNKDIAHNLKLTNKLIVKKIATYPPLFYEKMWQHTYALFSSTTWAILTISLLWGVFVVAFLFFYTKTSQRKKQTFFGAIVLLLATICCFVLGYNKYLQEIDNSQAILFSEEVMLKDRPSETAKLEMMLTEGSKVKIVDSVGEWVKVVLSNDQEGWVLKKDIRVI